ncbi:MAG: TIGR04255 family protein [Pirellulales bacterium]
MSTPAIPQPRDLANKPLVEAVFEVRWALRNQGPLTDDPGFQLFQGRYYDRVRERYPYAKALPAAGVPEAMTGHTVRQQFRASEDGWPVTQIGPGILTVNETVEYSWDSFEPLVRDAVKALFDAYPEKIAKLRPTQVVLRYINVICDPWDLPKTPLLQFLRDKLHISIDLERLLFDSDSHADSPHGLNLNLTYQLESPDCLAGANFAVGESNGKRALIFEITVQTSPERAPQSVDAIGKWTKEAHEVVDKWFFALIRGDLLSNFENRNEL